MAADGVFLQGQDLKCDESAVTGETDIMKKSPAHDPFFISGTNVTEGTVQVTLVQTAVLTAGVTAVPSHFPHACRRGSGADHQRGGQFFRWQVGHGHPWQPRRYPSPGPQRVSWHCAVGRGCECGAHEAGLQFDSQKRRATGTAPQWSGLAKQSPLWRFLRQWPCHEFVSYHMPRCAAIFMPFPFAQSNMCSPQSDLSQVVDPRSFSPPSHHPSTLAPSTRSPPLPRPVLRWKGDARCTESSAHAPLLEFSLKLDGFGGGEGTRVVPSSLSNKKDRG